MGRGGGGVTEITHGIESLLVLLSPPEWLSTKSAMT